jgi:two-component system sensor histidine kinase KdpD
MQSDLATLIDDEITQMNALCTELLQTAKLKAPQVGLEMERVNLEDLVASLLEGRSDEAGRNRIQVAIDTPGLSVRADRGLLAMILTEYVENALKYSTPDTPTEIAARESDAQILISVHNFGPAIPIEDRERIFERFYRSPDQKDAIPGTGIGLSIVRKAAEANHGHVWAISDKEEGTTFFLSLPARANEEATECDSPMEQRS